MNKKEYAEKERREAIIDCAGSYHPAVGGKYLPWNPWLHIRKTYTDEIDRLERELAETGRMVKHLAEIVTDLRLDRDEAIQQRDRLAEALEACLPFLPGDACGEYSDAKEAIAAVKGNKS